MQAITFLLLVVFTSVARATIYFYIGNDTYPEGVLGRINKAMNAAVLRYNIDAARIPDQNIEVRYNAEVDGINPKRYDSTIQVGGDPSYQAEWAALNGISHVIGIGETPLWSKRCNGGPGDWNATQKLLHDFDRPD